MKFNILQKYLLLPAVLILATLGYYSQAVLPAKSTNSVTPVPVMPAASNNSLVEYNTQNFRQLNQDLFKKLGVKYLKNIQVVTPNIKNIDVKHTDRYLNNTKHYDNLEKKYAAKIAKGYIAPMSVRHINDKIGYGVFAEADIALGDMVGEYTGLVLDTKDVKDTKYTWDYLTAYDKYGKEFRASLDAGPAGNEMRFVNHDYQPNAKMQFVPQGGYWHAVYIANRPIKKGDQILTDYGKKYWSGTRGEPHQFVKDDGRQN
jgi:hypothetical protein